DFRTVLPPQVVGLDGQGRLMDHGAHGPVEHEYTLFQAVDQRRVALQGDGHKGVFLSLTGRSRTGLPACLPVLTGAMLVHMRLTAPFRFAAALLVLYAALPAFAETRFQVRRMTRNDIPAGKGQCDIQLVV